MYSPVVLFKNIIVTVFASHLTLFVCIGSWPIFLCVVICVIALATLVGILLSARKFIKSLIEQSSSFVPVSQKFTLPRLLDC